MNIRPFIILFLGMLVQLSQVSFGASSDSGKSCHAHAQACECLKSCPCADQQNSNLPHAPLAPPHPELKILVLSLPSTTGSHAPPSPRADADVCRATLPVPWKGFQGVAISVAFCSFVI